MTDEDGVDVVEAIDAWIDEQIDDLTDDELESILEILDAVSASSLANVDASEIYDEDIDELVELAGGSRGDRAYANDVLRAAIFGDQDGNPDIEPETTDTYFEEHEDDIEDDDDFAPFNEGDIEGEDDLTPFDEDDSSDEPERGVFFDSDNDDDEPERGVFFDSDNDDDEPERGVFFDSATDEMQLDDGFLSDLANAQTLDLRIGEIDDAGHHGFLAELKSTNDESEAIAPVELRYYDELGPSFLLEPSRPNRPNRRRRSFSITLLPAFMVIGLAVFAFGMRELVNSLDEGEGEDVTEVATNAEENESAVPETESPPAPTRVPPTPAPVDPSAPPPTPAPEPTPPPRVGIRLVTGDVMLASFPDVGGVPDITQLYDASGDDFSPARKVAWLTEGLGIVDNDGNVLIVDPDARRPRPIVIYEAGGGFGEAVEIAPIDEGLVAVRTDDGDISLTPSNGRADPDVIQLVWDADEEGAKATDLSSVDKLILFVLDNGNAQMIVTNADNALVPIWDAEEQPPAFNVTGSESGILLGVGQGAVARYIVGETGSDQLVSVWDPFTREDEPAIGYSTVGDRTAIVTGNGAIVLADDSGGGLLLWDPETSEIRAFIALGTEAQVIALLESGSVVRIPLDPAQFTDSIWDITDETLSPANEVVVEPAND